MSSLQGTVTEFSVAETYSGTENRARFKLTNTTFIVSVLQSELGFMLNLVTLPLVSVVKEMLPVSSYIV